MSPEQVARTLAMFDAFLVHARAAVGPGPVAAHPPLADVSTAVTAVRGANPVAATADAFADAEVTRVTAAPVTPPAARPKGGEGPWEEPTRERPDIMRDLARSDAAQPDTDVSIALPRAPAVDPRVEQASIIIEDDSLTEPEFRREDVLRAMAEHARPRTDESAGMGPAVAAVTDPGGPPAAIVGTTSTLEEFATELLVLVKYGHAAQAAAELDRWVRARPEDGPALAAMAQSISRAASRAARQG